MFLEEPDGGGVKQDFVTWLNQTPQAMSVAEVKAEVHRLIDQIDDETYLREVMDAMRSEAEQPTDVAYELSQEELAQLPASLEAVKQGRYTTNEQLKNEVKQWLTR